MLLRIRRPIVTAAIVLAAAEAAEAEALDAGAAAVDAAVEDSAGGNGRRLIRRKRSACVPRCATS